LPPAWQRPLASLDKAALRVGVRFRVFGSAAWQALTGLDYLQADSDLDLVLRPIDGAEIAAATEILERWEAAEERRADVEIVFPGEDAVAWREWTNRDASVLLVKNPERVALVRRAELVARLAKSAATA
jgi:phosphoribosyl-dephospho-CoA transferase